MSSSPSDPPAQVKWNYTIEILLSKWCDQAKCFEWMHNEAYSMSDRRAKVLMITSNIVAAVGGLSNLIAGGTTVGDFQLSWVFGSLAIIVSITNMLQEKLGYATLAGEFKHYSTTWGSIRIKIEEQLAMPAASRKDCGTFLKYLRQDMNQVSMDGNAKIPESIRTACFDKFSKIPNFTLPDICGEMEHTSIYMPGDTASHPLLSGHPEIPDRVSLMAINHTGP
jgi:hypothetical protein